MPYVNVQMLKGASREQKNEIVKAFTDTLVRVNGVKPEYVHIVIEEIEPENWGFAGMLTDDYFRKQSEGK